MDKMDNYEKDKRQRYLTTGQAAALCSVTRNAVFKWIQSGQLSASRTAGGHHRIDRRALEGLLAASEQVVFRRDRSLLQSDRQQYCWEYNGKGKVQPACRECAVYVLRALRCYEVAKLAPEAHHARLCNKHCEDCDYFREMHGKVANVLVVTNDRILASNLLAEADQASFNLEITDCEYNCSAIVNHFKPDFVVVDCILGRQVSREISQHITRDPRIPCVRVVFAGSRENLPRSCDREVFARIPRPFDVASIEKCVSLNENETRRLQGKSSWPIRSRR
jgi:excisionase family DNA binding protein